MPTIIRQDGFRVMIYPDDHEPAHVHCYRGDSVITVWLGDKAATIREASAAAKPQDQRDALRIVNQHRERLWKAWRKHHG